MPRNPRGSSPAPAPDPRELLPDPELLRYYKQIIGEEAVKKVVDEFAAFGKHRRDLQTNEQAFQYDLDKREQRLQGWGQVFAFIVACLAIGGGIYLAGFRESPVTGGIITSGTVGGIVAGFLRARKPPKSPPSPETGVARRNEEP